MKTVVLILCMLCSFSSSFSQARPKLVVGMMIDQMRWDYLYRYADRYGSGGFKRLLREGFTCENAFIPFTPTYTAPGHASVYTGSVPALHGIAGNNWYDRATGRNVYCTEDDSVQTVGSTSTAGKQSPKNMWANTISDEMRLSTNFRSKTVAIAIKDRGSILPGGHSANGAYWFDATNGAFITSTYYMAALPAWVTAFNDRKLPDALMAKTWSTLYPMATYVQSGRDSVPYETPLPGEDVSFDHHTESVTDNKYESFKYTPGANTYTFDMAKASIAGEGLGKGPHTDMLAISFSAPDYIGHHFGPNSVEVEDMYLRFDRDLEQFLAHLDATVGKGQYLIFLTADHGVAQIPGFLAEHRLPGGTLTNAVIRKALNDSIKTVFGITNAIEYAINYQVYLNDWELERWKGDRAALRSYIIRQLLRYPGIAHAVDLATLGQAPMPAGVKEMMSNGYNGKRSGDIQYSLKPQWFDGGARGTTHGAWNPYDAHIPVLFFGTGIKAGKTYREVYMTDIAPTIAALLQIQMPNAAIGKVIEELMPGANGAPKK